MLKTPPPNLPQKFETNLMCDYTSNGLYSTLTTMKPENVLYDSQHPSTEEQISLMQIQETVKNTNTILVHLSDSKELEEKRLKKLFKHCIYNLKKLYDSGLLDISKSATKNYVDNSPIKVLASLFKNRTPILQLQLTNETPLLTNMFKNLKIMSNFYQNQPSNLVKICNFYSSITSQKYRNDVFRIKERKFSPSNSILVAFKFCNQQLSTTPKQTNIKKLLKKQPIQIKKENKFACKILNGLMKKCSTMPKQFTLKLPSDTKIHTLNPKKEIDLHNKLIPTVENTVCATVKKNGQTINVLKQKLIMKYDESKLPQYISNLRSITKESQILLKNIEDNRRNSASLKRKLPLPPMEGIKNKKLAESMNPISKLNNQASVTNESGDSVMFKRPMLPKNRYFPNNNTIIDCQNQNISTSSHTTKNILSETAVNEYEQKPGSSNKLLLSTVQLESSNEIRQKPLMKCLPFNKLDCVSATKLEENAKNLATSLSKSYCSDTLPSTHLNSELIDPIIDKFNTSLKTMVRTNLTDDPIVRNYIQQCIEMKNLEPKRKCKLPESLMSLPAEVLNLIPDNHKEIKYVVDFHHSMATVIVKVLDSYVKKNCEQGRIKNDEDFKYLAKKVILKFLPLMF